jgi:hypothetical protein
MNKVLGKPLDKRPAHGHVIGAGNSARWDHYYHEGKDQRKEIKRLAQASIEEKIDRIVNEKMRLLVQDELANQFQAILPTMVKSMKNWYDGGQQGPFPIPSFGASNSNNEAPLNTPTTATPPNNDAPGREDSSAGTMPSSTHSIFSGMPGSGSASTLAELDALMVTTRRRPNTFLLTCLCLPSSFGYLTPYMLSQDGTIPCTLLHYVTVS